MEPREGRTRGKTEMRDSSPLFIRRSESRGSIHGGCSAGEKDFSPLAWHRSYKGIPETARPSTAPVETESTYEPSRRRRYPGPARAASSLDSPDSSVPDQSPPYGADLPRKEAEGYDRSTPESVGRLLWETGVFDGLERADKSTSDENPRLEVPTGRSPRHQGTETRLRKGARCADKSETAAFPGVGERLASKFSHVQADGARKTNPRESEDGPEDHVRPARLQSPRLATTQAAVITAVAGAPVDRSKIALMAHIPVYCHQECQTDPPQPVPQKPAYVEAGTQTTASPTRDCQRCLVFGGAPSSPIQSHGSVEELLELERPQDVSGSSNWALDDADPGTFHIYSPDKDEETLSQLASERHQTHPAFQGHLGLEAQPRLCPGHDGVEKSAPLPWRRPDLNFVGHDATALSFVTPMENGIYAEETPHYPWGHEGRATNQRACFDTSHDDTHPIHRFVNRETKTYRPYPVRYRSDRAAAVRPSNKDEVVAHPHRPTLGAHVGESYFYSQDVQCPSEQPPKPSRPGIRSPAHNDVPLCECNMAGYAQDENQINMNGPSHLLDQRQIAQHDLEQAQIEADWRSRQLELARRYGY